jgi:hypothetical protein
MYLLDTGIVLGFQKASQLDALTDAAAHVPIAIVEEVYDEVTEPRGGKHAALASLAKRAIDGSNIELRSIAVGSPESATFGAFRAGKSSPTADLGEAASIALAAHDGSLTFVTNDAAASLRALQELRGRTLSFHPFLAILVERVGLSAARAGALATTIRGLGDWRATHPLWWDAWLASR